jgi:hypothetical protein
MQIFNAKQIMVYCGSLTMQWDAFIDFQRLLASYEDQ